MAKIKNQKSISVLLIVLLVTAVVWGIFFLTHKENKKSSEVMYPKQLSSKECRKLGDPVIDIHEKIINDADIAYGKDYWANDSYDQYIRVWPQKDASYCVEVRFAGTFDAQPGKLSPGKKRAVLTGDEDGSLYGGTKLLIKGSLKKKPDWPTTGFVGTTNLQCDLQGKCQNYNSRLWFNKYFETIEAGYPKDVWHEWIYQNGEHEWVNAIEGNRGDDIL